MNDEEFMTILKENPDLLKDVKKKLFQAPDEKSIKTDTNSSTDRKDQEFLVKVPGTQVKKVTRKLGSTGVGLYDPGKGLYRSVLRLKGVN
jgi:hypothetical protein